MPAPARIILSPSTMETCFPESVKLAVAGNAISFSLNSTCFPLSVSDPAFNGMTLPVAVVADWFRRAVAPKKRYQPPLSD